MGIFRMLEQAVLYLVRVFPFFVLTAMLIFPAYKGMHQGYLLIGTAFLAGGWLLVYGQRLIQWVMDCKPGLYWGLVLALPALLQALLLLCLRPEPWFDGLFVFQHAAELVSSGRMDPMTYYPPLQTWWYAGWFILFGDSILVAQFSHIPLSAGVTALVYRLGHQAWGESAARLCGICAAFYPAFIGYILVTPYYHYLYTALNLLMLLWLLRGEQQMRYMTAAGVAAGLGALTKGTQLIAPLQVAAWLLLLWLIPTLISTGLKLPLKKVFVKLLLFALGMGIVLLPWMWRNYKVFDEAVPVCTSGGLVLYSANNPESNGLYSSAPDIVDLRTPKEMWRHSKVCSDKAKTFIFENPARFMQLMWIKFLHTWGGESTFVDLINIRGEQSAELDLVFTSMFYSAWTLLILMWCWSSWMQLRKRVKASSVEWLLYIMLLSGAAVYAVFEGGDRHHLPYVPVIFLLTLSRADKSPLKTKAGSSG